MLVGRWAAVIGHSYLGGSGGMPLQKHSSFLALRVALKLSETVLRSYELILYRQILSWSHCLNAYFSLNLFCTNFLGEAGVFGGESFHPLQ